MKNNTDTGAERFSRFSDLTIGKRLLIPNVIAAGAILLIGALLLWNSYYFRSEKYSGTEQTAISAAQQIVDITVDSGVSAARNIYSNDMIYSFLSKQYTGPDEYSAAMDEIQQFVPLSIGGVNAVKKLTIFTANPTITNGGFVEKLENAADTDWYQAFMKQEQDMFLFCDPDTREISIITAMDFRQMDNGNAFLKVDLNPVVIKTSCDALNYDGELYIFSGGAVLYSNSRSSSVDKISITHDFDSFIDNYYGSDIEYYAKAGDKSVLTLFLSQWPLLLLMAAAITAITLLSHFMSADVKKRAATFTEICEHDASLLELPQKYWGSDELGTIIDICKTLSKRLTLSSSQFKLSNETLMEKSTDYHTLYATAMRLDAQLAMKERYPELCSREFAEYVPLHEELDLITALAGSKHTVSLPAEILDKVMVPAYCLFLITEDLLRIGGNDSLDTGRQDNAVLFTYSTDVTPSPAKILKLNAIFEDNRISEEYSFSHEYEYNPYLRLKHCLGSSTDITIDSSNGFTLTISIIHSGETAPLEEKAEESADNEKRS